MNYSDIQCDNNLIKDKCCKIKYSGFLFKNNSDSVTIIYGFGDGWNNTDAQEMTKTDDGFVANIKMIEKINKIFFIKQSPINYFI